MKRVHALFTRRAVEPGCSRHCAARRLAVAAAGYWERGEVNETSRSTESQRVERAIRREAWAGGAPWVTAAFHTREGRPGTYHIE